jgi:alkanesulfonate monooxygenase SsuD/methylene tetrahydromethanopterin reductase-like flavin-dependent oxidoreductase (luciferase family)
MKIGYFTERPYQDPALMEGRINMVDLMMSNDRYDPMLGSDLYNRYLDEKVYAEEMGFDMLMLNEHHSTPFCMGGVMNVEASILARITSRAKIVLLGNVIPIWDDPLWLAETLAVIDMISRGRLVSGWVRGTGRESVSHNSQSPYNWARFQEAHDFIVKAWTTPGPFRWEGEHYHYRYVNPWMRPYQQPHPPIWVPGILSKNTVEWCARNRIPYIMLATLLEPTKQSFDFYDQVASDSGYEAGPQHRGYLFKVHVDETEELAYQAGRKFIEGPGNIFLEGSRARANPFLQNLPGLTSRTQLLPTRDVFQVLLSRGRGQELQAHEAHEGRDSRPVQSAPAPTPEEREASRVQLYQGQLDNLTIITGTPKTVIPKVRQVLELLRPGHIFFWDGDGAMSHEDAMRSLRLMGEEVIPAARQIGEELGLVDSFEVDPKTGERTGDQTADGKTAEPAATGDGGP